MKSVCLITEDVKFNHLLKVVSARFSHCKLLLPNALKIHPCRYLYKHFFFSFSFLLNCILLYGWTTIHLSVFKVMNI